MDYNIGLYLQYIYEISSALIESCWCTEAVAISSRFQLWILKIPNHFPDS